MTMIRFFNSTIGKKIIVAITGLILFGFVVGHLLGNLQVFSGAQKINDYAAFLKANPPVLWGTRVVLLIALVLHFLCIVQLTIRNKQSRPQTYDTKTNIQSTLASRIMVISGGTLLAYIIFHLLHMTVGSVHPDFSKTNIYRNMIIGFSSLPVVSFYVFGMIALGYHLYHGVWSVFQTLGINHEKYNCWRRCVAIGAAVLITVGYISIPVAIYLKVIE